MKKKVLCYHTPSLSSFVKKDIAILEKHFKVKTFVFNPSVKWKTPFELIKQKIFILRYIFSSKIQLVQFGGYHSLLPALLAKIFSQHCIVIAGGTDCVGFPEIGYGNFHKPLLGKITCLSFRLSTIILPVDESLERTENTYSEEHSRHQGIRQFCKNLKTPIHTIYNGYDAKEWYVNPNRVSGSFISVAAGLEENRRFVLKGFDLIIELAKKLPHCKFTFVGTKVLPSNVLIPSNVELVSFANTEELKTLFSKHQFYLQLSISEGFPNAICEAMLCGCIPLGSNVAAIPKIIGDTGYILKKRDPSLLFNLASEAILNSDSKEDPRKRIMESFPLSKREYELLNVLNNLT